MTTDESIYDTLIRETRELDARGKVIQGERDLEVDASEIEELVDDYNSWYVRAISVIPSELGKSSRSL